MIRVGLIGLGAIGRVHFGCWRQSAHGKLVAISSRDPRKLAGDWAGNDFNLGEQTAEKVDLTDLAKYESASDLISDPDIDAVDICLPTPHHAPLAIAALRAGKHVFCEKPMALNAAECTAMEEAAGRAARQLMVGHCLRYWPQYLRGHELVVSGEYGRPLYASFFRSSPIPLWSSGGWLMRAAESGGVMDLHIHDIDVALWWFGRPRSISVAGHVRDKLPLILDGLWQFENGLTAHLHGAWDPNGGVFNHAFRLVLERATLVYDLLAAPDSLRVLRDGQALDVPMEKVNVHQAELDDFAASINAGRAVQRFTPAESRLAVEVGQEELDRLSAAQPG